MGTCFSSDLGNGDPQNDKSARQKTTRIDKQLEEDARKLRKECKILLLGSGESGKSTIVKQMKIIHQNGFSQTELLFYRPQVYRNLLDCARTLIAALHENGVLPVPLPLDLAETFAKIDGAVVNEDYKGVLDASIVRACEKVWVYPATKRMVEDPALSHTFYLMDSAEYFFEAAPRIATPDYCPTESDVLRARTKTTGIFETRFTSGNLQIHMFDVGGQRSERKKWIHCFEAVTSIIFCVALSEYDQVLLEESGQNRMEESLALWESVVNSRWFVRTSVVLFLNKVDLFKGKLGRVPLRDYFPEYEGGSDPSKAAKFILYKFTKLNRAELKVYPHLTQATDTGNIRLVFAAVKETILQNALQDSGIL
ncbi:Guanine nucleotide-binding protein alpha-2 subunit [Saitoella coloradoensis]